MFRRILVPVDGSEPALRAARLALEFAQSRTTWAARIREAEKAGGTRTPGLHVANAGGGQGASETSAPVASSRPEHPPEIVLLTVVSVPQALVLVAGVEGVVEEFVEKTAREALEGAERLFAEGGVPTESIVRVGSPSDVIAREAAQGGFDAVVIGKRGLGEVRGLLLGSVSDRVAHHVDVPVVLVP